MRWERVVQLQPKPAQQQQQEVVVGEISGPGKRWGHTCNAVKEGRLLYVFGGYGRDNCQTNQVHVFDTATHTWSQPVIKGSPPTPRDSHSCTAVGDNLFVFGGTDGTKPLNDLYILDTSSHTWISPSIRGDGPQAREGHSAALVGRRLFIFGGCGKSATNDEDFYNDLYILNTETFVWKCAATVGKPPSPRDSHTCSSWHNKLIVIGGEDEHDYYLSDVHILDADTLIWRELDTSGHYMPPRAGHSTVSFGKKLFVFGGFTDAQNLYNDLHMLDVDTGVWTKVITIGDGPSPRFSVAGDCLDPVKEGVLVFIGGCNKSLEALDDLHYLHTGLARESERRPEILSLRKQLKLKCQEQNQTSFHDRPLVRIGTGADMTQPMPVPFNSQPYRQNILLSQPQLHPEKKTFEVRFLNNISDAYMVETVVDGKPLRGVLFPNKSNHYDLATAIPSRKRATSEAGGVISNGDYYNKGKTSRSIRHETIIDHRLADHVHGKESASNEQMETVAVSISKTHAHSDDSQLHKVSEQPEQSVVPLNVANNQTNNNLNSNAEVEADGSSHRKNDAPNFGTEAREHFSAITDTAVASSLTKDVRTLATEGQTDATSI